MSGYIVTQQKKLLGGINMYYDYECKTYDNYDEFKQDRPDISKKLLADVGESDWMNDQIYFYPTIEDYAIDELYEGWYAGVGLDFDKDFRGAPNPLDYIDMEAFGNALTRTWDESMYWTDGECVVSTSCGW